MSLQEQLLTTKLYIPPTRSNTISRLHLLNRLDTLVRRELTLVSSPAGFGKTTLLSTWCATAASKGWSIAWISLDTDDNDPIRFWSYLIVALKKIVADLDVSVLSILRSPQPPSIESILVTLINLLAVIPNEIALILDDYHLVEAPSIHNAIMYLIDHLPDLQVHLEH